MGQIIAAMLAMTGRITMLGISRWTGRGGSYRTVQRFFNAGLPWAQLFWQFFKAHLFDEQHTYIIAGDEVVISKSGKHTHGLDDFFSGLENRVIKSIALFTLSLIDVDARCSYPIQTEQIIRPPKEDGKAGHQEQETEPVRSKPGRPKGSKNRNKEPVVLSRELIWVQNMLKALLEHIGSLFPVHYLVLDGQFGNRPALQMTEEVGLHLISKLRCDAALYFPYTDEYAGRGAPRKYGARIDYQQMPEEYLLAEELDGQLETRTYQLQALHRNFPQPLNVVIITRRDLRSGQFGHAILFSSDLQLSHEQMIDYYSLRFQIEFNFRAAKQHWGMEDFMNIKALPLTNALNLSLFMVNVSQALLPEFRQVYPQGGVLDLKAYFRAARYFEELLKLLPQRAEVIFNPQQPGDFLPLGCIHPQKVQANSP
jgi:hypothetical protein